MWEELAIALVQMVLADGHGVLSVLSVVRPGVVLRRAGAHDVSVDEHARAPHARRVTRANRVEYVAPTLQRIEPGLRRRIARALERARVERYFFFSSRRRHTRFDCDWSSDVCSSDLLSPMRSFLREACRN